MSDEKTADKGKGKEREKKISDTVPQITKQKTAAHFSIKLICDRLGLPSLPAKTTEPVSNTVNTHFWKSPKKEPLFSGSSPDNNLEIYFQKGKVEGDGNCGITGLGTTRKEFVDSLHKLKKDSQSRKLLIKEIYQAFITEEIPPPKEWKDLLEHSIQVHSQWDNLIRSLREQIKNTREFEADQIRELINWLKHHRHIVWAETLTQKDLEVFQADDALNLYCSREEIYEQYVNSFLSDERRLWIGHSSALLYAKAEEISLYIWESERDNPNKLRVKNQHIANNPQNTIHLYYPPESNHFDLLVIAENKELSTEKSQSESSSPKLSTQ